MDVSFKFHHSALTFRTTLTSFVTLNCGMTMSWYALSLNVVSEFNRTSLFIWCLVDVILHLGLTELRTPHLFSLGWQYRMMSGLCTRAVHWKMSWHLRPVRINASNKTHPVHIIDEDRRIWLPLWSDENQPTKNPSNQSSNQATMHGNKQQPKHTQTYHPKWWTL